MSIALNMLEFQGPRKEQNPRVNPHSVTQSTSDLSTTHIVQGLNLDFIQKKQQSGFGAKDFLRSRYLEFCTAEGFLNRVRNFVLLGGIGYFFTPHEKRNITGSVQQLELETSFYRACLKTQDLYNRFQQKPTNETYQAASQAFEALHELVNCDRPGTHQEEMHQQVNTLLEKVVGVDVAQKLLEHFAHQQMTRDGTLSDTNIAAFYKAENYQKTLLEKEQKGYGPSGLNVTTGLTSADDPKSVRMVFANVFRSIVQKHGRRGHTSYLQALEALKVQTIETCEINSKVGDLNVKLFHAITSYTPDAELFTYISEREQLELINPYQRYMDLRGQLERTQIDHEQTTIQIRQYKEEHHRMLQEECQYSYRQLLAVLPSNPLDNSKLQEAQLPEGFEEFCQLSRAVQQSEAQVAQTDHAIRELEQANPPSKEERDLQALIILSQSTVADLKFTIPGQEATVKQLKQEWEALNKSAPTLIVSQDLSKARQMVAAVEKKEEYQTALQKLQSMRDSLNTANQALDRAQVEVHNAVLARETDCGLTQLRAQLQEQQRALTDIQSESITVTRESVYKLAKDWKHRSIFTEDVVLIENLEKSILESEKRIATLVSSQHALETQMNEASHVLTQFGFDLEEGSLNYEGFQQEKVSNDMLARRQASYRYLSNDWLHTMNEIEQVQLKILQQHTSPIDTSSNVRMFSHHTNLESIQQDEDSDNFFDIIDDEDSAQEGLCLSLTGVELGEASELEDNDGTGMNADTAYRIVRNDWLNNKQDDDLFNDEDFIDRFLNEKPSNRPFNAFNPIQQSYYVLSRVHSNSNENMIDLSDLF